MDACSPASGTSDDAEELRRLRRQLARERARRLAAERIGERASENLDDSARELRTVRAELLELADQTRVVDELSRALRRDIGSAQLINRAAESVGRATAVDRCDVLLVDPDLFSAVRGSWSGPEVDGELPGAESFVDLPEALVALLLEAAGALEPVQLDHVAQDPRLGPEAAAEIIETLGARALAAVPVAVGDEVAGWLLVESVTPRAWQSRELAICVALAHDLATSLIQVHTIAQQRELVRRLGELDHAKDTFVSSVSHELRTPLTSIIGYVEMLAEGTFGNLDDGVTHGMEIIERNVDRLRSLVEDLLTLSAYDEGRVHLDLVDVDLDRVVADCLQLIGPETAARQLEMVVLSRPGLPTVRADRDQIRRVVHNLLGNAVKFSHVGAQVTTLLRADGDSVLLRVLDTGIGIPGIEQHGLFTRFFRSRRTDEEEVQGSGLGLALVQTVVEGHGGTVELDSVEGEGTTVTVRLPRSR